MSSKDLAVSVRGLSKAYTITHNCEHHTTMREALLHWIKNPLQRPEREIFWALQDVNFDIKKGDVVGIIGRNGAGKSTLLKILSQITEPTKGEIRIYGRIGSLLEVGTGFHPELTGRENIFLNGSILGMRRDEIERQFDAIVDFAEVEQFLDTPVKRYSSGMHVRLAFAVAAHLDLEILVMDEVLAVGGSSFQKKCLGKMKDVSDEEGRTILFVSHNMLAVQKLCSRGLLLNCGRLEVVGPIDDIVDNYIASDASEVYTRLVKTGKDVPYIVGAKILTPRPRTDTVLEIAIEWYLPERTPGIKIGIGFNSAEGQRIFGSAPEDVGLRVGHDPGHYRAIFRVPPHTLLAKNYTIALALWTAFKVYDYPNPALGCSLEAAPSGPYAHESNREGLVHISGEWILN